MKVSISLPAQDVVFLDKKVEDKKFPSRSAAMHKAIILLQAIELEDAYEKAWQEWAMEDDCELWSSVIDEDIDQ